MPGPPIAGSLSQQGFGMPSLLGGLFVTIREIQYVVAPWLRIGYVPT